MALVSATMVNTIVTELNSDPSGKFQIKVAPPTPSYDFIKAACDAFVLIWPTIGLGMSPGTGPPPAGTYLHKHTFLPASKAINLITYQTNTFNLALAGGQFHVPPDQHAQKALEFICDAWGKALFDLLYAATSFFTLTIDGGVAHTHNTPPVPTPYTSNWAILSFEPGFTNAVNFVANNWGSLMVQKFSPGTFKLTEPLAANVEFFKAFTKGFLAEIRDNSTLIQSIGQGHIHAVL